MSDPDSTRTASAKSNRPASVKSNRPASARLEPATAATVATSSRPASAARPKSQLDIATANPPSRAGSAGARPASATAQPPASSWDATNTTTTWTTTMPPTAAMPACMNMPMEPASLPERQLAPRSIFITGANKGLGLAMVRHFVNQPTTQFVFAACRDPARATELDDLRANYSNLHLVQLEVTSHEQIADAVKQISHVLGDQGLNLLINNAGVATKTGLDDTTAIDLTNDFATNAAGPFAVTQAFVPLLKQAAVVADPAIFPPLSCDKAGVVNIGAGLGSFAMTDHSQMFKWFPYRISKAALHMVSRCLSYDLAELGILVVAIHPGWVQTDMGGTQAPVTADQSIAAVMSVLGKVNENHRGALLSYDGTIMPW